MSVYGNGFLAYHLEVGVALGRVNEVRAVVKEWKKVLRCEGTWPGFPDSMVERLGNIPGVTEVVCEGPQSSILIPLRMVHGLTGTACTMSTVLGTGAITRAIEDSLETWGLGLETSRRLADKDSPIEISFRDPTGKQTSLRLYPDSLRRYQCTVGQNENLPDHLILNRFNQGLRGLAEQVSANGGCVSLRPRKLGRYDHIEDYGSILRFTNHLVLSSRHDVMLQFARHVGIQTARGWPEDLEPLEAPALDKLAAWLVARMQPGAIVVFNRFDAGDSVFYREGYPAAVVDAPGGYGHESRAARIQGALLGRALQADSCVSNPRDAVDWQRCCEGIIDSAFSGTDARPWRYPRSRSR